MTQHPVSRISVILLGVVIITFGAYHFMKPAALVSNVPSFLPGGKVWVYLVGAAFILAGIAFMSHKMMKPAGYLLASLLLIFVVTIHLPNYLNAADVNTKQMLFASILKDIAIAAFAMYIASNSRNL